jgi:uncharacterized membrane protein YhaH (DUF805 family)
MLGFIFGFNARIGRIYYFLGTLALAAVMAAVVIGLTVLAMRHMPRGARPSADDLMTWPVMAALVGFAWASFTLQSMRIRDIGWDPVCIIPGWIAMTIVDHLVANKFPAWSVGRLHHGTVVGSLVNLALFCALAFWPGGDHDASLPALSEPGPSSPSQGSFLLKAGSIPAARIARATRTEFGQR